MKTDLPVLSWNGTTRSTPGRILAIGLGPGPEDEVSGGYRAEGQTGESIRQFWAAGREWRAQVRRHLGFCLRVGLGHTVPICWKGSSKPVGLNSPGPAFAHSRKHTEEREDCGSYYSYMRRHLSPVSKTTRECRMPTLNCQLKKESLQTRSKVAVASGHRRDTCAW